MHFTPPLRANSELGDTLEPFLWQSDLQETTSSHIITHSHQQVTSPTAMFSVSRRSITLLLLLLDFETNCVADDDTTKINKNQQRHSTSHQQQKSVLRQRQKSCWPGANSKSIWNVHRNAVAK
jgi:hypothetical protein